MATQEQGTRGKQLAGDVELRRHVFWDYRFDINDDDDENDNYQHWKHISNRHYSKCCACNNSLILLVTWWASNYYHRPQFHRWVPGQLSNLPKVTQLVSERAREGRLRGLTGALRLSGEELKGRDEGRESGLFHSVLTEHSKIAVANLTLPLVN